MMHRILPLLAILSVVAPATLAAQDTALVPAGADSGAPATDTLFLRAQRLVSEGHGSEGRAIVDSMLAAAPAGSAQYAEALFWHASLAATAAEAERDYRRLAVEFPLSPRSEDALIRLGQMEYARGDHTLALEHFQRLVLEHPRSPLRPRVGYWMARVLFDDGQLAKGCAQLAAARAAAPASDVELRNQIGYYAQRCTGVDTTVVARGTDTSRARAATPAASGSTTHTAAAAPAASRSPVSSGRDARPDRKAHHLYTVQVAAYATRAQAERLARRLRTRGYDVRVTGQRKPYRVRIGRYATRAEAEAEAKRMKAHGTPAWVAEAEAP